MSRKEEEKEKTKRRNKRKRKKDKNNLFVIRRVGSIPSSKTIPWIQVRVITPFVIVHPRHRLMPFPRPGYVMRLLVVCLGVLLWLGVPSDILPLTEPLSLVPWVRNRLVIPISPNASVWTLGWGWGPPPGLRRQLRNPGLHCWPSENLSFWVSCVAILSSYRKKQKDPQIIITLHLYPNMMVGWVFVCFF